MIKLTHAVGVLCLFQSVQPLLAQSSLVLTSGGALSLSSAAGSQPAALQWTFSYPTSVTGFSVTAGPALSAAGKSINCSGTASAYTCIASGMNSNMISNGVIGTVSLNPGSGTVSVAIPNAVAASPTGSSIAVTGTGAVFGADATPPSVSMTAPANGATVTGTVTLTANATDNVGVAGVQFKLDGANLGAVVTGAGPSYSYSWNTSSVAKGTHTLSVVASDAAGNLATSSISVILNDTTPPTVSMTAPTNGATVTGTVTLTANATDNVGVTGVQFKLDGANLGAVVTGAGPSYSYSWNTSSVAKGTHTLSAVASDAAGNTTTSNISVTVNTSDKTAPTVSITSPANGATVGGTVTLTTNATDNVGVTGVQFKLDGANLGAVVTGAGPSYSYSWNTSSVAKGTHTLSAVASDAAGNTATSTISVTVNNTVTVSMTTPTNGASVAGTVTVTAAVTGSASGLQFKLDGVNLGALISGAGPSFSYSWNTTGIANGTHTLSAVASCGYTAVVSQLVSVTVNNNDKTPPTVSITSPTNGAAVTGMVTITATATDNVAVASLQFQVDGVNVGNSIAGAGPYSVSWNPAASSNGAHTITAIATDSGGNTATSMISVTVTNPLLQLRLDSSEVTGVTNGSTVTPAVGPTGFAGKVVVNGTGSVNFAPAQVGNGVFFQNCCANTNNAYYKFTGTPVGTIFNGSQGQITFSLKSQYSFTQRLASAAAARYAFDVRDGNGNHLFYFLTQITNGSLVFAYLAGGSGTYYYVPAGTEDTLFGNGVTLQVNISWSSSGLNLYLNNTLVKTAPYTPATPNWSATSNFDLGAYEYLTFGGYNSSDDVIDEFSVIPVVHP